MLKLVTRNKDYELRHPEIRKEYEEAGGYRLFKKGTKQYFLMKGEEFVGRIGLKKEVTLAGEVVYDIRPKERRQGYGKIMMQLFLEEMKKRGKQTVLLVCRLNNIASRKIIEYCGGQLLAQVIRKGKDVRLLYRIGLTN